MNIQEWGEKINPVVNFGDAQSAKRNLIAKIYYRVKGLRENLGQKLRDENFGRYYTAAVIVLVGLSSFGLGRLSILDERRGPIIIEQGTVVEEVKAAAPAAGAAAQSASVSSAISPPLLSKEGTGGVVAGGKIVASKNGTKYYYPWCASNIAEKNKVWFNSEADARAKGYTPAANCKGLR